MDIKEKVIDLSIGERIAEVRKSLSLSQEEFGKVIGLGRSIIGCYEKNLRNVSDRAIRDICINFNINEEWLKNGEGEKYTLPQEVNELTNALAEISLSDNTYLQSIIPKLLTLDDKYLILIENLIDSLIDKDND